VREDASDSRFDEIEQLRKEVERLRNMSAPHDLAAAEYAARDRSERLAGILSYLVQTVLPNDVTTVILNVVTEALGAAVATVSLLSADGKTIETPSFVGDMRSEAFARFRTLPIDARVAAADVIRTGSAVFIESPEALASRYPSVHATTAFREGARCAVPLAVAGRVLGSLNLGFSTWRIITNDERTFIRAAADQCALALERARLFEAEQRARREAEATTELTKLLFQFADTVNRAETLEQTYAPALDVVINTLHVDRAAVLLVDSDGVMRFKAVRGLSEGYCKAVEGHSPWGVEDTAPKPILVSDVESDDAWSGYRDLFRREGIRAIGFVPLVQHRRLLGKFMVYCNDPRVFTEGDVALAGTIALQIAQAVARARLLDAERAARSDAEWTADRLRRLQKLTSSLSEAITHTQIAHVLVTEGVEATRASTGGLWLRLRDGDAAELVHAVGYSDGGQNAFAQIDFNESVNTPVADALRSGTAVWIDSKEEFAERYSGLVSIAAPRPEYRLVALPIMAKGTCIAALAFTFDVAGRFPDAEREFLLNIARQGGHALERALSFEVERAARAEAEAAQRRASFKADAGAALASSLEYETTLKNVAKLAVPRFADWCSVDLGDESGHHSLVAVEHVDPTKVDLAWRMRERYPMHPTAVRGIPRVLRTGSPELYEEISDELLQQGCQDEEHLALARSLGLKSAITAPMSFRGQTVGAITFILAESGRRYDREDLETAVQIGERAAIAIENAKLHRDLQRAVRARDDLLAMVSHDLRNPLSIVTLRAAALTRLLASEPRWEKAHPHTQAIHKSAGKMERLVNDLLDLGSIEAGQLKIEPSSYSLRDLLSAAEEEMRPFAAAKEVQLRAEAPATDVQIRCDKRRILQVFANLIGNAIKFTPAGGAVLLRSNVDGDAAVMSVSDTGRGIPTDHMHRIFDRYYQAPSGERSGVGFGLFIARGIVTAHGGRIWAESKPDSGSTFSFTVPLSNAHRNA
jgi:signal transduction histidine kinase